MKQGRFLVTGYAKAHNLRQQKYDLLYGGFD